MATVREGWEDSPTWLRACCALAVPAFVVATVIIIRTNVRDDSLSLPGLVLLVLSLVPWELVRRWGTWEH